MKIYTLILMLVTLVLLGCGNKQPEKPANLIPIDTMQAILYDLAIIDAARVSNPQAIADAGISQQGYIYEKYKIDSLQFAQSNAFYTSDLENYIVMYEKVLNQIEIEKVVVDSLAKEIKMASDSIQKKVLDSIKKVRTVATPFRKKNLNPNIESKRTIN
jgi:uncharacterized lipoprotein NlpE involved in copper resistance